MYNKSKSDLGCEDDSEYNFAETGKEPDRNPTFSAGSECDNADVSANVSDMLKQFVHFLGSCRILGVLMREKAAYSFNFVLF